MIRDIGLSAQSSTAIIIDSPELQLNKTVYVIYDGYEATYSSTGLLSDSTNPDYITWKTVTQDLGNGVIGVQIDNTKIFPRINSGVSDYSNILPAYLSLVTTTEFLSLGFMIAMLDKVHRQYRFRFPKKFSVEELLIFLEAALVDINLYTPITTFWWNFQSSAIPASMNNYMNGMGAIHPVDGSVPSTWANLISVGGILNALASQGILEVDINYQYSDQGISIAYNNAAGIQGWWSSLVTRYDNDKKRLKQNYRTYGRGVGTVPIAGMGWTQVINNLYGNRTNETMYPWWGAGGAGRAQM